MSLSEIAFDLEEKISVENINTEIIQSLKGFSDDEYEIKIEKEGKGLLKVIVEKENDRGCCYVYFDENGLENGLSASAHGLLRNPTGAAMMSIIVEYFAATHYGSCIYEHNIPEGPAWKFNKETNSFEIFYPKQTL